MVVTGLLHRAERKFKVVPQYVVPAKKCWIFSGDRARKLFEIASTMTTDTLKVDHYGGCTCVMQSLTGKQYCQKPSRRGAARTSTIGSASTPTRRSSQCRSRRETICRLDSKDVQRKVRPCGVVLSQATVSA